MGEVAALIGAVTLLVSACVGLRQYWRNSQRERMQWVHSLFEKFYEADSYREIRRQLDWHQEASIRAALSRDTALEERWNNYLNFFEFIAYLWQSRQLDFRDIEAMFEYWLRLLKPFEDYMREYGYENLVILLSRMKDRK